MTPDGPLEPSSIAQFVEHDRCPRYISQRVNPGGDDDAREWREAYTTMNSALLGTGREFEATQIEALAADATHVIGPDLTDADPAAAGVPDIDIDETWAGSTKGRHAQLQSALERAANAPPNDHPYVLLYQAPLNGTLGDHDLHGDADCIALAPAAAIPDPDEPTDHPLEPTTMPTEADVIARVIDCKSARDQQPGHRVQVASYCALLEQTLGEGPAPTCHIEGAVLTRTNAHSHPFTIPPFRRLEWELFAERLLAAGGPIDEALTADRPDLPYALDQVCDNCAYREACTTRAVEAPTSTRSLALLGLDASVQTRLREEGIDSLEALATLTPPLDAPAPTDDRPTLSLAPDTRRSLEAILSDPVHETIQRAQTLYSAIEPDYDGPDGPQPIPNTGWVPLPDDRRENWSNLDAEIGAGDLIHVALIVRPDPTLGRIGAISACVYADAYDEYHTIADVIDAVPDDEDKAASVERTLLDRFTTDLFETIETVAVDLGAPEQSGLHCYTYSDHEHDALVDALDRHADHSDRMQALRALYSLDPDGQTGPDQAMTSAVQPIINDHFALRYPTQGLLQVTEQFVPGWTIEAFDPLDARPDDPPLRAIFREQLLNDRVPYLQERPGIRLHLAHGPLAEGPAAAAADTTVDQPSPDGWYPVRKRPGTQFPIEYLWAVTPRNKGDSTPRLSPEIVEEWGIDEEHVSLYRQEIGRYYYRTDERTEPLQNADLIAFLERLSYALMRLIEAIPYKDAYSQKAPIDATDLASFEGPAGGLPATARDYLRMEHGRHREELLARYRRPLRQRARNGYAVPIRCTELADCDDGGLEVQAELAYDALFEDGTTAARCARRARLRGGEGSGGGSWRVLTRLAADATQSADTDADPSAAPGSPSPRGRPALTVEDPEAIQHSPPALVEAFDPTTETLSLRLFGNRFRRYGGPFRVDHCGWTAAVGSNVEDPTTPPSDRPGYVAGRDPVTVEPGAVYVLDSMVDDFGAPKADCALSPKTIEHNACRKHLQAIRYTGQHRPVQVAPPAGIEAFLDAIATNDDWHEPNDPQQAFIEAVDRPIVPLQGPPGTGKTSGATAPALLARAYARWRADRPFTALVVAPSHEAVDGVLEAVVEWLDAWQAAPDGADAFLPDLVRVRPTEQADEDEAGGTAADGTTPADHTDTTAATAQEHTASEAVTHCGYTDAEGTAYLEELADRLASLDEPSENPSQQLLFVTPATLYRVLGIIAAASSRIDGDSAPAAMRHTPGLADVVCIDEASMVDLPRLFLATSTLDVTGQTLLVGDHRQLATISSVDWEQTDRKPLEETQAYRSALGYLRQFNGPTTLHGGPDNDDADNSHGLTAGEQATATGDADAQESGSAGDDPPANQPADDDGDMEVNDGD